MALSLAFATGTAVFVSGCDRQEVVAASNPITIGTEIDDTVVTTKVKSALLGNQDIKGFDIKVETRKGMVLLSGFVDSRAHIDRAIAVAQAVDGVQGVVNEMSDKK